MRKIHTVAVAWLCRDRDCMQFVSAEVVGLRVHRTPMKVL